MSEEKEMALFTYHLDIRKIVVEKLIVGLFVGIIIAMGGYFGNIAIEQHREMAQKREFFLQKRLEAVMAIREAYTIMFEQFDLSTFSERRYRNDLPSKYEDAINDFSKAKVRWGTVLSPEFNEQVDYHLWIFSEFRKKNVIELRDYRNFVYDLLLNFDSLCRNELGISQDTKTPVFELEKWSCVIGK